MNLIQRLEYWGERHHPLLIYFLIAGNGPWSVKINEDKSKSD